MQTGELDAAPAIARPPWAMAWVLLLASAAAVVLVGVFGTVFIVGGVSSWPPRIDLSFAARFLAASALTAVSLGLRSLRWVFLLRRAETRIPIRDAYIGYFAGLSLLFAPFLIGEIAVRVSILRSRGRVPIATTIVVNLWERLLDLVALGFIGGIFGIVVGRISTTTVALLAVGAVTLVDPVRDRGLRVVTGIGRTLGRMFDGDSPAPFDRLARRRTWLVGLVASVAAWLLPGIGFWMLASAGHQSYRLREAEWAYALSASTGGLVFAPGGVLVAGARLLEALGSAGAPPVAAAVAVLATRLATAGVATVLGGVFVLFHFRSRTTAALHFDQIADAYDVQIPEARRRSLLARKTELMRGVLDEMAAGRRGLDVGCGQGAYVARMRELDFDVSGFDASEGQVRFAARKVGGPGVVTVGSVLDIPVADASYDFAYAINVLHHLSCIEEQRRAFTELFRVLRPGGVLFVHEINTRNIVFRFYMGYLFPSLNCIDEGVERWLLPDRMAVYTDVPVTDIRYFTFLPDFLPAGLVRLLTPLERMLEGSRLRAYSAHYMAVFRKGSACGHAEAAARERRKINGSQS